MKRKQVVSSNIDSIGYNKRSKKLEVEFKGGSVYQYEGVPAEVYQGLMNAKSAGGFLSQWIKGVYRCQMIG